MKLRELHYIGYVLGVLVDNVNDQLNKILDILEDNIADKNTLENLREEIVAFGTLASCVGYFRRMVDEKEGKA